MALTNAGVEFLSMRVIVLLVLTRSRVRTKRGSPWMSLNVLECPWIWKQKFKDLNILEFVKKYLRVLKFFLLYFSLWILFFEIIIVWHSKRIFCSTDFACSYRTKLQFYWFLTPSPQYLVLEFADIWPWMSLKTQGSLTLPDMDEPCRSVNILNLSLCILYTLF
jgi:hypothetical protein